MYKTQFIDLKTYQEGVHRSSGVLGRSLFHSSLLSYTFVLYCVYAGSTSMERELE